MGKYEWQALAAMVRPHIVRVMTPRGSGTGFLLFSAKNKGFCALATAAHVVDNAHYWEQPVRLRGAKSGKSVILRVGDRAILINEEKDVAAIAFRSVDLELPETPLQLFPKDKYVRVGVEVAWLGYPAISPELCFFSGRISTYVESEGRYLVDGVAINGVSGGPAFMETDGKVSLIGVLSAYIPNRATGETLPGLAVVADIAEFYEMVAAFESLEDARTQETPPSETPPPPPPPQPAGPPADPK